ncbi:MAG TPA: RusA family crossover junction endodeoxyribonuclease, partial [Acidisoma sp.]|nr:RusA family crossover junction endodeoxyribonuclease [Acidisoma sp.]
TQAMWGQRMIVFNCPVIISIVFEDAGRADIDNLSKGIIDHLVHHRLIRDDSRPIVREIHLRWGGVKGAVVTVSKA